MKKCLVLGLFFAALSNSWAMTEDLNLPSIIVQNTRKEKEFPHYDPQSKELYEAGLKYYYDVTLHNNYEVARKLFEQAAKCNHPGALCYLGLLYYRGQGGEQNYKTAIKYFLKATTKGHKGAQSFMEMLDGDTQYHLGRPQKKYKKVGQWFLKAIQEDPSHAQNAMGYLYQLEKNYTEALAWYLKAAEHNLRDAQYNIGMLYCCGKGVEKNDEEAIDWFRRAGAQNHKKAKQRLRWYLEGKKGI